MGAPAESSPTDAQLIGRLRGGDRAAFAALITRHQQAVFGYLRARLAQATDAEDLTQEVFLRFYLARARFDSAALIRPWLLGIARNLLREQLRDRKRRKETAWTELCLELESVLPQSADTQPAAGDYLPECLAQLGPSARQAIEWHYRLQEKFAEIGRRLKRSEGAIKLLMHRARLALRECLERRLGMDSL